MPPINDWQKKRIHVLAARLGLYDPADDTVYRAMLEARCGEGITSSLQLSYDQAQTLIESLTEHAVRRGLWKRPKPDLKRRYEHLGDRPGYASPGQLRMIEAIWAEVSYQKTDKERERALLRFVQGHYHVAALEWIESRDARKIVRTLEAMRASKKQREAHDNETTAKEEATEDGDGQPGSTAEGGESRRPKRIYRIRGDRRYAQGARIPTRTGMCAASPRVQNAAL